ncbi:hypothetical protein ALMP_40680 [Streptomyces sp. A012304]|nr:hypothetical protein ALMP_40680 [Streptomyces sp. A012304]
MPPATSQHVTTCAPSPDDAEALSRVHFTAWLESYPNPRFGIDEDWIRQAVGRLVTPEGVAQWRRAVEDARDHPDLHFCRVARTVTRAVGFLCGHRAEAEVASIGPMYVLAEFSGRGIGSRLMNEYLSWVGERPVCLWVTVYNTRAIRFYTRHGFEISGERRQWRGKMPIVRMIRHPEWA